MVRLRALKLELTHRAQKRGHALEILSIAVMKFSECRKMLNDDVEYVSSRCASEGTTSQLGTKFSKVVHAVYVP